MEARQGFLHTISTLRITDVTRGCGRLKNRMVKLSDGTQACARYRANDFVLGNINIAVNS